MKRLSLIGLVLGLLITFMVMGGCGRGVVQKRTIFRGDHAVTLRHHNVHTKIHGAKKPVYSRSFNKAVKTPGR